MAIFCREHHVNRAEGVRILTVFLYLNDVEAGGGTDFPRLGITVQPKRGRAVIWASVLDEDPNAKDARTHHQALPVEKGVKYGANAWLHQRDFKLPYSKSCH
jgi:prolyl 4-hydroxylase